MTCTVWVGIFRYGNNINKSIPIQGSVFCVGIFRYMATTTTKVSRFRDQSYGWESSDIWQQQQQKYPDSGISLTGGNLQIYGNYNNKSIQIQGSVFCVGIFKYMAITTTKVSRFRDQSHIWDLFRVNTKKKKKIVDAFCGHILIFFFICLQCERKFYCCLKERLTVQF